MTDTPLDLAALKEAVAKMTAGPWSLDRAKWLVAPTDTLHQTRAIADMHSRTDNLSAAADAKAIVLLRNSAEQLIALACRTQDAEAAATREARNQGIALGYANKMKAERDAALARCAQATELLRRLRQWDVLQMGLSNAAAGRPYGDEPYWCGEIDRVLADTGDETT